MCGETGIGFFEGSMTIAGTSVLVVIYYLLNGSKHIKGWFRKRSGAEGAQIRKVLFDRLIGVFLFGIVPVVLLLYVFGQSLQDFGLATGTLNRSLLFWLPVATLAVGLAYLLARGGSNLSRYPQIRAREWDIRLILLSALSWMVYITGYELMFRGVLLFACYASFGFWPAILINILLYALAHIPKGSLETFGSIPAGFVFCFMTLHLGSIWFALLTHITIALSYEWFSLYFNREMQVISLKREGK